MTRDDETLSMGTRLLLKFLSQDDLYMDVGAFVLSINTYAMLRYVDTDRVGCTSVVYERALTEP